MLRTPLIISICFLHSTLISAICRADVRPHPLIAEGVVLQRNRGAGVGTADPGETVVVDFRGQPVQRRG